MDVFSHLGLTLAAVYLVEKILVWVIGRRAAVPSGTGRAFDDRPSLPSRSSLIDYRLLALGAILPDLIDKPLAFLANDFVNNSLRSVGHSLAFQGVLLVLAVVALIGWRYAGLFIVAAASAGHLIMDRMWEMPGVLFWPFQGWGFPRGSSPLDYWIDRSLLTFSPSPIEMAGFLVLAILALRLVQARHVGQFFRRGGIP